MSEYKSMQDRFEAAIGGAYEMPDGREFWIDLPVAREIAVRIVRAGFRFDESEEPTPEGSARIDVMTQEDEACKGESGGFEGEPEDRLAARLETVTGLSSEELDEFVASEFGRRAFDGQDHLRGHVEEWRRSKDEGGLRCGNLHN